MTRLEGFVDHFEANGAIIEMADRSSACVSRRNLPTHVHAGDFIVEDLERQSLTVDAAITQLHHREIRLMNDSCFD
ncbi:MAG: hypothetical protein PHC86_05490 [Eubacteriales bacterium]|nr:hypothetical protein [Eubacteriales bacterium]